MHDADSSPSHELLTVEVEQDGETLVLRPQGELDLSTTQPLDVELRKAIASGRPEVILDLSGLSFIDSGGLRFLTLLTAHSRANGDRLRMLRGQGAVERRFQLSGLDHSLPFID